MTENSRKIAENENGHQKLYQQKKETEPIGEQLEEFREAQNDDLKRAQHEVNLLQFRVQQRDDQLSELLDERIPQMEEQLAEANRQIEQLLFEKQQLLIAANSLKENGTGQQQKDDEEERGELLEKIGKLEQKLANANQEKDYYKRHFRGEQQNGGGGENGYPHNGNHSRLAGGGGYTDDFGKELMLANKRKYQLESRVKQLEMDLREAQQRSVRLSELFGLEKAQTARLDAELMEARRDCAETRRQLDGAILRMDAHHPLLTSLPTTPELEEAQRELRERLKQAELDAERRVAEVREAKSKVEWRLGEVTQMYHDTKWRLGEVEALLAHRDWQLEHERQLNSNNSNTNNNNNDNNNTTSNCKGGTTQMEENLSRLTEALAQRSEEKERADWRIGELTQLWNDAKWRVGELEAETAQRSSLLDQAHHRIGELERRLEGDFQDKYIKSELETSSAAITSARLAEMEKAYNDTKWRLGEVEAELRRAEDEKRHLGEQLLNVLDQKSRIEWRLGEVVQHLNDSNWRIGELEAGLEYRDRLLDEARSVEKLNVQKLTEMSEVKQRLDRLLAEGGANDTLLVRKQPHVDRHKWKLMTIENALDSPLQRVWLETDSAGAKDVFLIGSFLNWECALVCEPIAGRSEQRGIWLDLPAGRHEFCFICDAQWRTSGLYGECWNEHGKKNNWIDVQCD